MKELIETTASRILEQTPGVVVRHRLLRDVLKLPQDSPEVLQAKEALRESKCIRELEGEQWADGGWGPFHSQDTSSKQKIPTTEVGVERAVSLGLDGSHTVVRKASDYILRILSGDAKFPDYPEKNDRWPTGVRIFCAATLSRMQPDHPSLDDEKELWCEIAKRTFGSGKYSVQDEIDAHAELTGATVKDSYLVIDNKYTLNILGAASGMLPGEIEIALLEWLWTKPVGIRYLDIPLSKKAPDKPGPFDRWLTSVEILSRLSPEWTKYAGPSIEWIIDRKSDEGYWDFGKRPSSIAFFPLSDNWRTRKNRLFDWTTRILLLLKKFDDDSRS